RLPFLLVTLVFLMLAACSKDTSGEENEKNLENLNESGFPIVDEPIDLKMFATEQSIPADWNDIFIWNEYEDMTNINVEWEQVPGESVEEKRNLALGAGGDLPDAFYISSIPSNDIYKYGKQGTFLE